MAVNGISANDLSRRKVLEFFSEPGSTVSLEVHSGENRFTSKILMKHSFDWPPRWQPERVAFDPEFEATPK